MEGLPSYTPLTEVIICRAILEGGSLVIKRLQQLNPSGGSGKNLKENATK
jgi:hypothetical protein